MPVKKLTAGFWKTATAEPGAERTVYWDAELRRFGLMVTASGHRSGVAQYRSDGVSRRYTINHALGLEAARKEALVIFGRVARGNDPVLERRKLAETGKTTLKAVCERYLAREGSKLRTTAKRRANLERLVYPKLGNWQIDQIKRSDINYLLDEIEDDRGRAMADQVLALLRRICNWHAARTDSYSPPFIRGMSRRTAEERERSRILSDDELQKVWRAAERYSQPWGYFIRFLLLTASRRTEAADMTWGELSDDGVWTIPASRYKTNAETTLPLSKAAMKLLNEIPHIGDFVFTTNGRKPISGFSTLKLKFDIACGVNDWRLHDLRRTSRSLLSRAGVHPDIAERCLGHAITGIRGTYDKYHFVPEMRGAFEALAKQIAAIVKGVSH
jgi:integrase